MSKIMVQSAKERQLDEIISYVKIIKDIPPPDYDMKYKFIDTKLIKYMTRRTRGLFEYRFYIDFLKKTLDVNHCAFYKDYSMENGHIIEMHHSPFTMFDLCQTVANKHLKEQGYYYTAHVAMEVMKLHYEFKVGLIPLNPTAHQLIHSGELKVHPSLVVGDWEYFVEDYKDYLSDEVIGKYEEVKRIRAEHKHDEFPEILKRRETRLEIEGFESLGSINVGKFLSENAKRRLD